MANTILRKFVSVDVPAPKFAQIRKWLLANGYIHTQVYKPYGEYPKMSYWSKLITRNGKNLIWAVNYPTVSRHKKFPELMGKFIGYTAMKEGMSADELYNEIVNL